MTKRVRRGMAVIAAMLLIMLDISYLHYHMISGIKNVIYFLII